MVEPIARGPEPNSLATHGLTGGNEGAGARWTTGCATAELCV